MSRGVLNYNNRKNYGSPYVLVCVDSFGAQYELKLTPAVDLFFILKTEC